MRGLWILLLFIVIFILAVVYGSPSSSNGSLPDPVPVPEESLLPLTPKHETAIVAAPDGTVYYLETATGKILWSFSSGPSMYSSYQERPIHEGEKINASSDGESFFIDFGENWNLYLDGPGLKKVKLPFDVEEFVRRTPFVLAGGVILGSKKTSVFLVDAKTGKIVRKFMSDNSRSVEDQVSMETAILTKKDAEEWLPSAPVEMETGDNQLYVTRTDNTIKYISSKTGKVLWYLMFANVEASFHCEGIENFFGGSPKGFLDSDLDKKFPIHCHTGPVVYNIRDRSSRKPLIMAGRLQGALPGDSVLSLPAPDYNSFLEKMDNLLNFHYGDEKERMLALPNSDVENFTVGNLPSNRSPEISSHIDSGSLAEPHFLPSLVYGALIPVVALFFYVIRKIVRRQGKLDMKQPEEHKLQNANPKKRKGRKGVNKQGTSVGKKQEDVSPNYAFRVTDGIENKGNESLSMNFSDNDSYEDGRKIGKLIVFDKEIAKGSNGTIVLEGNYGGRPVAVKRLVRTHHDIAVKEIRNLIASDQHPNIVRWYGVEYDRDFVYLSLERCACSLHELISFCARQNEISNKEKDHFPPVPLTIDLQLLCTVGSDKELELWKVNGYPSAGLIKLMRDIVRGVAHLHELGIVHRDLKPQNVLVIKDRFISAKISDMGISKRLDGDVSSLTRHATGYGSSGWQAPEQLRHERQTRAVDLFSLGCILFFCITGGKHPFGENLERDINIVGDNKDLFLIDNIPEATDLISRLLNSNPELRPNAVEVSHHPLFWSPEMRLSFLRDVSDRVELEDRAGESELLEALENCGKIALGGKWDEKMDTAFMNDIGRYRRYKYDSVRDLLRVIRNKLNHFRELSKEIQALLGPVPEGFDRYFSTRFPKLLIEVYSITLEHCAEEEFFHKYFKSTQL